MASLRPDIDQIRQTVALVLEPGYITELRVMKTEREGTISGYFSDPEKLVAAAMAVSGKGPGVYVTLNRIPADLLARADNRIKSRAQVTTKDDDIIHRNWLLIDCDPVRAAGVSSTDAEHEAGLQVARNIREDLMQRGWPEPVLADSGNGGHVLPRLDLPNDTESADLIKRVLKALAQRYNSATVTIDESVFNAARISKLYGTIAAKGDSTADRPHRVSRFL